MSLQVWVTGWDPQVQSRTFRSWNTKQPSAPIATDWSSVSPAPDLLGPQSAGQAGLKSARFLRTLRMLRLVRLARVAKLQQESGRAEAEPAALQRREGLGRLLGWMAPEIQGTSPQFPMKNEGFPHTKALSHGFCWGKSIFLIWECVCVCASAMEPWSWECR